MNRIPPIAFDVPPGNPPAFDRAFIVFDRQDSGCLSYGTTCGSSLLFVKTSTTAAARESLLSALRFHEAVQHPAIVRPTGADVGAAVTLVYPWIDGAVLNHATVAGSDRSILDSFRRLPLTTVHAALATVLDAHAGVARADFVSVDFYDGAMLYDFSRNVMHLIDLDHYRPAPFTVEADRLPGSRSYMAPEEFSHGARIAEMTMVFTMGRALQHLCMSDRGYWRGTSDQHAVVVKATAECPNDRYQSLGCLIDSWKSVA